MKKKAILALSIGICALIIGVVLFLVLSSKKTYTVTFDSSGGSIVESQKIKEGDTASEPKSPTKEKYVFVEWTKDGKTFNFNTLIESDITLVASWKKEVPDEYEITIDYKNGNEVTTVKVLEGNKLEKPEDPTYKGYDFKGWGVNGQPYDFEQEVISSFTIEAEWEKEKEKYTVTFDSNGGSKVDKLTVIEGEKATKPEDPTKNDNTFVEWQLNGKTYDFEQEVTKNITLKAKWKEIDYPTYRSNSIHFTCVDATTNESITVIKPGDKIKCNVTYEVYAEDAIKTLTYDLKYGEGLKLIETTNTQNAKVTKNNYKFTYNKPMAVGSGASYIFEVIDKVIYANSTDYNLEIDNIKFITDKGNRYSQNNQVIKYMSIWEKMNSSHVYNSKGFTLECVDKDNKNVEYLVNGDTITCEAYLEVNQGDEIKYLRFSFSSGISFETVKTEMSEEFNYVGEYHYIANTPTTKLYLGKKTLKVINENDPHMMMVSVSGTFITTDDRTFTPEGKTLNYKNGNSTTKNQFKQIALDIIDKAKKDLISTNKLEAGTYYVTNGSSTKSPLGGNIKYYTTKCDKIGSTLCKRNESSACTAASRTHIIVNENNGNFEYGICLTAGGQDYTYIYGSETDLLNNDDFSMIYFPG